MWIECVAIHFVLRIHFHPVLVVLATWTLLPTFGRRNRSLAQGQASVPPPEGWKKCPRCENNKDRMEMDAKYKVDGHAFDPHDLSGVWGFAGLANAFRNAPPLTEWGKQQHAKTMGSKNAAGELL